VAVTAKNESCEVALFGEAATSFIRSISSFVKQLETVVNIFIHKFDLLTKVYLLKDLSR